MPAGRPPNPLNPDASAAAKLGAAIRDARVAEGLTLEALGGRIGYTPQHISAAEQAKSSLSKRFVAALDDALSMNGQLLRLFEPAVIEHVFARLDRACAHVETATVDDDVRRRAFLGLGFAAVLFGPEAAARGLSEAEAEHVAYVWSREIATAPDSRTLLLGLAADLKRLHANQRVVAQLASYVASIAVSSGDPALAKRWWRRARTAAAASGDSHLMAFVAARQAVQGVHGVYSPAQIVMLADDALSATTAPCTGRMHALSARAQGLAMLGRTKQTRTALSAVEREFERLPRDVTRERVSVLGWPEDRLHFCASFVGACSASPYDAERLYSPTAWRGHAQVRLHRAAAEADASYATQALLELDDAQRADRFIRMTARRVIDACEARGAGTAELREALA
jgi:transcriptional regulator with XRE-family HTH domain